MLSLFLFFFPFLAFGALFWGAVVQQVLCQLFCCLQHCVLAAKQGTMIFAQTVSLLGDVGDDCTYAGCQPLYLLYSPEMC